MRFTRLAAAFVLVGMLVSPALGGFHPGLEFGMMISPGYDDYMKNVYPDGSGASSLGLGLNAKIDLTDHVALVPSVDVHVLSGNQDHDNVIVTKNGRGDDKTENNSLIVPALHLRYSFKKEGTFYLQGGPSFSIVNVDSRDFEFDGGIGGSALLGYAFLSGCELDLGYHYVPVDAEDLQLGLLTRENFGGPFLRVGFKF